MKIKDGYILREVAGTNVVIPIGEESVKFNGVLTLNDSGAFLWKILSERDVSEEELVKKLLEEYEVDEEKALGDVKKFVACVSEKGFFE